MFSLERGPVDRWGNRSIPAPQAPSCSPPNAFGGETQGPVFRQPPEPSPLPRRERQRGSPSQGAGGHPLERDTGSPSRGRRKGRCFAHPPEPGPLPHRERQRGSPGAKGVSVKGSRPAIGPSMRGESSMQGDSGPVPSSSSCLLPASHQQDARPQAASPRPHARSLRYAAGDDPTADLSAALRRRRTPPRPAPPRPARRPPAMFTGMKWLHCERSERRAGARTRPRTPVRVLIPV